MRELETIGDREELWAKLEHGIQQLKEDLASASAEARGLAGEIHEDSATASDSDSDQ
jgi:hypothetical protein